jgi:ketosteroid isomerase-like protein
MSQENVEVVRRVFEARNRGDIEAALACATQDVVIDFSSSQGPWAGIYRGHEGIRRQWGVLSEAFDQFSWEAEEFIDAGEAVVVPARFFFRGRESRIETSSRGAQVYWLAEGKIVRYRQCQDRAEALAAVGLSE